MAYNFLESQLGFISYILMFVVINVAFFIHEFSKVCIANVISEHAVTKGVPVKKFIEPIGLILMMYLGIGWSNSPEISAVYFKDRKKDMLKVYVGAVLVNVLLGLGLIIFANNMSLIGSSPLTVVLFNKVTILDIIYQFGVVIFAVGIMNLIPMVPFSGYHILYELVSPNTKIALINNRQTIQILVLFALFFGVFTNIIYNLIYIVSMI